jgi:hypothetical protein
MPYLPYLLRATVRRPDKWIALSIYDKGSPMALSPHYRRILEQLASLPDTAKVPLPVAALHEGVSVRTIKRNYPLIRISEHREGVSLGYLRHRSKEATA